MKKNQYIHLPNGNTYVNIGRSGSSSINKAIAEQLFPERLPHSYGSMTQHIWHVDLLERSAEPIGQCIVIVRDPVERFRSYCAHLNVQSVDRVLDKLEAGETLGGFSTVTSRLGQSNLLFKFPEHLDAAVAAIGVTDLEAINGQPEENKPTLAAEQLARVEAHYADDIEIYESITEAGQTYTLPPESATDESKAAKIRELEAARYQAEVAGTTVAALGDAFVRTDKETQSELGKALAILTIDPAFEIDWKFPDGTIVNLTKAQIDAVAQAVFTHVQTTRTTYKDKAALVEAASTKDELDAVTWQ